MAKFEKGNPNNYRIKATLIKETDKAYQLNCEGDIHWFPKSQVIYSKALKELELSDWIFKEKFPNG